MHRQILSLSMLLVLLVGMAAWAQDSNQTIPITQPPTRRIEPPPADASPQDLEDRGDQLRGEKAYLDSIDYYQAAMKRLPKGKESSVVCNKLGMAQVQMGHFDDAKRTFEKAVKLDHDNANALNNLGSMHYHSKKYGRSIKYYKRAISLQPDTASFHANLGSAYLGHKDLDKADAEYLQALQLDPNIFETRSNVGVTALMSPEDRAKYSYLLAKMYAKNGQLDRSLLYLRRAMEEGYKEISNVYQDEEFARLRKDERFAELMKQPPVAIP